MLKIANVAIIVRNIFSAWVDGVTCNQVNAQLQGLVRTYFFCIKYNCNSSKTANVYDGDQCATLLLANNIIDLHDHHGLCKRG